MTGVCQAQSCTVTVTPDPSGTTTTGTHAANYILDQKVVDQPWSKGTTFTLSPFPDAQLKGKTKGHAILNAMWPASTVTLPPSIVVTYRYTAGASGQYSTYNLPLQYGEVRKATEPGVFNFTISVGQPSGGDPILGKTTSSITPVYDPNDTSHTSDTNFVCSATDPIHLLTISTQGATKQSDGSYLLTYPLPDVTVACDVTGGAYYTQGDNDPGYYDTYPNGTRAWGSIGAVCATDTRAVTLSRPGAVGETYNPSTNTTFGDTIYSSTKEDDSLLVTRYVHIDNWQLFNSNLTGGWPAVQGTVGYSWTPAGTSLLLPPADNYKTSSQFMPRDQMDLNLDGTYTGKPSAATPYNLTYSVTDPTPNNGATATANYVLTVHEPFEKIHENPEIEKNVNFRVDPNYSALLGGNNGAQGTFYIEHSDTWTVGVSISGDPAKFIAALDGLDLGLELSGQYSTSTNNGAGLIFNTQPHYSYVCFQFDRIDEWAGTANHWQANGSVSTGPYAIDLPDLAPNGFIESAPIPSGTPTSQAVPDLQNIR